MVLILARETAGHYFGMELLRTTHVTGHRLSFYLFFLSFTVLLLIGSPLPTGRSVGDFVTLSAHVLREFNFNSIKIEDV
jgi:hypothetical protein